MDGRAVAPSRASVSCVALCTQPRWQLREEGHPIRRILSLQIDRAMLASPGRRFRSEL